MSDQHPFSEDLPELPGPLQQELLALYGTAINVPAGVDESILSRARAEAWRRRRRSLVLRWSGAVAAAAAATSAVLLLPHRPQHSAQTVAHVAGIVKDLNA